MKKSQKVKHPSVTAIIRDNESAWRERAYSESVLQEIYRYCMPNRNSFDGTPGGSKMNDVFDSTAIAGTLRFAGKLQKGLTPPYERFFELKAGPLVPADKRAEMDKALQEDSRIIEAVFHNTQSHSSDHELYQDLAAGQGIQLILEGDDQNLVRFITVPLSHAVTTTDGWDELSGLYWKKKMAARHIKNTWPGAKLSKVLQALTQKKKDKDQEVEILQAIYRHDGSGLWLYDVIYTDQANENGRVFQDQFHSRPFIAPRWSKLSGESGGRGVLHTALPDIKTANKLVEMTLMNAALAISGVYTVVSEGVINPNAIGIFPGAMIPVERNGGNQGPTIMPLKTDRKFDVAQLILGDLRMSIKKLLLDNQLPPDAGVVRSPTEILARMKEISEEIGGAFPRLLSEMVIPKVQRVIEILTKKGLLFRKIKIDQLLIKLQVVSPLARLQSLADVESVMQYLNMAAQIVGPGPQGMVLAAKIEQLLPWLADMMGVPKVLVPTKEEQEAIQKQIAQLVAGANDQGIPLPDPGQGISAAQPGPSIAA